MLMTQRSNIQTSRQPADRAAMSHVASPRSAFLVLLGVAASAAGCAVSTEGGELTDESQEAMQAPTTQASSTQATSAQATAAPTVTAVGRGPVPQLRLDLLAEIGAGGAHTCVRRTYGRVWCWGRNDSGQTGSTPVPISPTGGGFGGIAQPSLVAGLSAAHLAIGYDHSCALTSAGQALCWGSNWNGALGQNSATPAGTPAPVGNYNGAPITFSSLGAGQHATCGVEAGTGHVFCWGELSNNYQATFSSPQWLLAQSGYQFDYATGVVTGHLAGCVIWGQTNSSSTDTACWTSVSSTGVTNLPAAQWYTSTQHVSTASNFICADQTNGTVECVGVDNLGQLGDGIQGSSSWSNTPQAVGGGLQLHGVSAGDRHACALDPSNNIVCWGANDYGQLGNGTHATVQAPTPINAPSGVHFRAVAAGENHTCAIGTDDHVYCWGSNFYFQIGAGSLTPQNGDFINPTLAIDPT
jgi:hypothetical protein